jgi:uncharacterized protein YndB with AHSA1/START domain
MSTTPDSLRIARTFDAPPGRLYRAWTDADDLARWNFCTDGMTVAVETVDVRVGGRYRASFGLPGDVPIVETNEYREVVPGRRLVFDNTLARGDAVYSRTRCTVEFLDRGERTQLILTEEGDSAGEHASGWGHGFDRLAQIVA